MRAWKSIATLGVLSSFSWTGCVTEPPPDDALARVADRYVRVDDYKRYLERSAGLELGQISSEAASAILDQYLEEILLAEYALSLGNDIAADRVAARVRLDDDSSPMEVRDQMLRDSLLSEVAGAIETPSREEIERYYQTHPEEFLVEDRVHVRQILLPSLEEAEAALARLERGAAFSDLAREVSVAPTAERGGDIGVVARGDLPKAVEEAVFAIDPGEHSGIVETAGSFHIFEVLEHFDAGTIELERAVPLIESRLEGDALSRRMSDLSAQARRTIDATVFTNRVPFDYSGTFSTSSAE